jgi:hypothetical protein
LALAALATYREPTRRSLIQRSTGFVPVYAKACRGLRSRASLACLTWTLNNFFVHLA